MYITMKDVTPGNVVLANRNVYYDQPDKVIFGKVSMFLVTKAEDTYFFGCRVVKKTTDKTKNILKKEFYPLEFDSRVSTNLYKVSYDDIVNPNLFKVTPGTLNNIKRNIYKRIVLGHNEDPREYQDIFINDYMREHVPQVDNIIVYPSDEKKYRFYYIYEDNLEYYSLIRLNQEGINCFSVADSNEFIMSKNIPYFDYYVNHSLTRDEVDKCLFGIKEKKIGSIINRKGIR